MSDSNKWVPPLLVLAAVVAAAVVTTPAHPAPVPCADDCKTVAGDGPAKHCVT